MTAYAHAIDGTFGTLSAHGMTAIAQVLVPSEFTASSCGILIASEDGSVRQAQSNVQMSDANAAYTAIAVSGEHAWVTDRNGELLRLEVASLKVEERVFIPAGAVACACNATHVVYAFDDGRVHLRVGSEMVGMFRLLTAPSALFCFSGARIAALCEGLLVSYDAAEPDVRPFILATPRFKAASGDTLVSETGTVFRLTTNGGLIETGMQLGEGVVDAAFADEGAYILRGSDVLFLGASDSGFDRPRLVQVKAQRLFTL